MSTIFQVFPTNENVPSFRFLLDNAEQTLAAFIERRTGFRAAPRIAVSLLDNQTNRPLPLDLDAPARWPESSYAWFSIVGLPGGTDSYFDQFDDSERSTWLEELETDHYAPWKAPMRSALAIGHSWRFRRSAGQPASINVAYAVLAAQLATVCDGFVDSSDSAWDYALLPAWPSAFLTSYFDPAATASPDMEEWARRCIAALPDELAYTARPTSS